MAPRMAAVLQAPGKLCSFSYVLFVFLLCYVLDVVSITVYDRDTLLNIGSSVAQRKPDFEFLNAGGLFTDTASEPFVWVAQLRKCRRRRKRGKRAGVLVRLRRRAFRPPLPTILLANVQSLDNKLCELRARISYQRETRDCCVICLTETWMSAMVPDSAIELTGFSVHRSDRAKELTGKSRGGGVCFYINNSWCNERNIHSIKSFGSPDLEFHTLLCRPFWLPREFIKDSSHPSHRQLSLLPSGRRFRSIRSRTSRLRDSFFPQANEQSEITHLHHTPTHTTCHALHFNTVQLDYTHTLH